MLVIWMDFALDSLIYARILNDFGIFWHAWSISFGSMLGLKKTKKKNIRNP